jgi:hypothetical protein
LVGFEADEPCEESVRVQEIAALAALADWTMAGCDEGMPREL